MEFIYDVKKLTRIIDDLCTLTGLCMAIADKSGKFLHIGGKRSGCLCELIQGTPEGKALCSCSDSELIRRAAGAGTPLSHVCHAGLYDTVAPIFKQGALAGFIFIGRVRTSVDRDEIKTRLSWLDISEDRILDLFFEQPYLEKAQLKALTNLLSDIVFEDAVHINEEDIFGRAAKLINQNIDQKITVNRLCRELFVSKNRLYKSFDKSIGLTVNEYIADRRIARARELLLEGKSVKETAELLGFENFTYFSKLFKRKCGRSPIEYKRDAEGE